MRLNFQEEHPYLRFGMPPIPLPMVPVTLIGRRGLTQTTYALVDTGADESLFHAQWTTKIGLDLFSGRKGHLFGIVPNSAVDCYYHRIYVVVGTNRIRCEVAFSEDIGDDISDQLIGRMAVFDRMRFAFRQRIETFYIGNVP